MRNDRLRMAGLQRARTMYWGVFVADLSVPERQMVLQDWLCRQSAPAGLYDVQAWKEYADLPLICAVDEIGRLRKEIEQKDRRICELEYGQRSNE